MEKFFTEVMARLEKDLAANEGVTPLIKKILLDIDRISAALNELLGNFDFYKGYSLNDANTILFNKIHLPPLLAKLVFAHLFLEFERQKEFSTSAEFKAWCLKEFETVKSFFETGWHLYRYWQTNRSDGDEAIFCGDGKGYASLFLPAPIDPPYNLAWVTGNRFDNAGLLTLAGLMAYEQYKKILKEELDVRHSEAEPERELKGRATWNKKMVDLAEQIVGQYEYQTTFVDGKPATLDFLKKQATHLYTNVTLKQIDAAVRGVTSRSKGAVEHHQSIILALQGRGERLVEGRKAKRN